MKNKGNTVTDLRRADELKNVIYGFSRFINEKNVSSYTSDMSFIQGLDKLVMENDNASKELGIKSQKLVDFLYKVAFEYDEIDKKAKENLQ